MLPRTSSNITLFSLIFLFLACIATPAKGEELNELSNSLGLTGDEPAATSRFPRPVSKIAENVTVITARDIVRLNAHTLAEVLNTVPGFQLDQLQTPGSAVFFSVLGITSKHILVQMDGVPLNFISADNIAEIGNIPVQMIDRVELIKGAASAAWGSALGGVINISTKSPATDRELGGMASGSFGDRSTADLRTELSGTVNRFGYYLTGGLLRSDGLTLGNQTNLKYGFGKFNFELPNRGKLTLGLEARQNSEGLEESASYDLHDTGDLSYLNGYLALHYPLADRLTLELNARGGRREVEARQEALSAPILFNDPSTREIFHGEKLGLTWGDAETNLSAGVEHENNEVRQREPVRLAPDGNFDLTLDRWSGYLNGTYSLGRLSILPGFRIDHTNLLEDALSYTLGATYRLTDSTILRGYAARGYSMPVINNVQVLNGQRELQNIWTLQTGFESSAIPYLWLKGTLFYNNIWKIQAADRELMAITLHEQIRQGIDLEFRTSPLYGLALTGGYTYVDAWDRQTKAELTSSDNGFRQGLKLGLNYDNSAIGLRAALTGNYVDWYLPDLPPHDSAVIWDLHLTQKLFPREEMSPELFFSAHNIFDGAQYQIDFHASNPRWFEGGVRCHF